MNTKRESRLYWRPNQRACREDNARQPARRLLHINTNDNPQNKLYSKFIFDYEQELILIWNLKLESKISKVLSK